ncbi:MAG TPA: response regulator transcription factor [Candidatus Blautia merdavium]|uniref:Stage 0 sporulation protein A homolog n=1 Tax=Candidatus Blautia merdavium TaxID=2838494 RepID=A0A9D2PKK2_9FIRM|nr:response regulator transcription factor [Candidatus Blautia merdavium]
MVNKILLLEDDESLNRGISLRLEKEGYQVYSAFCIQEAEQIMKKEEIWLLISDITLPDGNGMEFGRKVRKTSSAYIIYLSVLDQEVDIVNGYDSGGDDYITKPFSLLVLLSKVNALKRRGRGGDGQILASGDLEVHCSTMQVYKNQEPLLLSKKELQLLVFFLENARQIVTKEQILAKVWDAEGQFVDENTVTVTISRLKSKLKTNVISNIRGLGYLWTETAVRK